MKLQNDAATATHGPRMRIPIMARAVLLALRAAAFPTSAHAYWVVVGPPVIYAPPPVVYAAPPVVYEPVPPPARSCYAGAYVCPLNHATPTGGTCSCPTNNGGRASGHAR